MIKNRTYNLELVLHLSFWLLLFSVFILVYQNVLPLKLCFLRAVSNIFFLGCLFYFNAKMLRIYLLNKRKPVLFVLYAFSGFMIITLIRGYINLSFPQVEQSLITSQNPLGVYLAAFMTSLGILAFSTLYHLLKDRYQEDKRKLQIISERNEAELKFLKNQINPHFLFNTLNNIYSLAVVRSEKTAAMVLQLSKLLRYVIYDSQQEKVPLSKEVEFIKKFIDLYQMRSETALNIDLQVEGKIEGTFIEPMIVNPLVENCFKHSDFETNKEAFARFKLSVIDNTLNFYTKNTKNTKDQQKDVSSGVGLENIRRRLQLIYPNRFQLETSDQNTFFEVKLQIKLDHANYKNLAS